MKKAIIILWSLTILSYILTGCGVHTAPSSESAPESKSEIQSSSVSPSSTIQETLEEQALETEPTEETLPEYLWEFDASENHGVDGTLLESLHDALPDEIHSVVLVKDGVIIDEFYNDGYDETSGFWMASVTKSVTGALVGVAIDEGLIGGVDDSIAEYLPEVAGTEKENITIGHLLQHTSGVEWYQWDGGRTGREMRSSDNWLEFWLGRQMIAEPGSMFAYSNANSHVLSVILERVAGMTMREYAEDRLFTPMGITVVDWDHDPQGHTNGATGMTLTPRDVAKFGQLYLDGGVWDGKQLVPTAWVEQSTKEQFHRSGRSGSYGYQWWIQAFGGYDGYYAMGTGGQYIFVVPELELVTVMTCDYDDTYAPWPYYTEYILAACE
jgi:CubicO group peptidase (beta-lactamase class C family)